MPKPYAPRDLDKAEPMRAAPEAAEAIRRMDELADEILAVATGVSSRTGRMQALTRLALLLSGMPVEAVHDEDGNLVSEATSLRSRVAEARAREFQAAHDDSDGGLSLLDIARITGITRAAVATALKGGKSSGSATP